MGAIYKNGIQYSGVTSPSYTMSYASGSLTLYTDSSIASTVNLSSSVADVIKDGITTDHVDGVLYIYCKPESPTYTNSSILGGIYSTSKKITRPGTTTNILCLSVGSYVLVCSHSSISDLLGRTVVYPGDTFFISNEMVRNGNTPYLASMGSMSSWTDPSNLSDPLCKVWLGAGMYMAMTAADFTTTQTVIMLHKIAGGEEA